MELRDGRYELELAEAMKFNQMGRLGDRTVGTVPPLELHLDVEEKGERSRPNMATVVVKDVQMQAAGRPLVDKSEQRIAFLLFRFGGWDIETPAEVNGQGRLRSFTLQAAPPLEARGIVERQGFAMLSPLSSMYSALFNEITLDDEGAVRHLDHHADPGELGSLIPADYFKRPDRRLKLWVLHLQAADERDGPED